jgi:hypothetical protein
MALLIKINININKYEASALPLSHIPIYGWFCVLNDHAIARIQLSKMTNDKFGDGVKHGKVVKRLPLRHIPIYG